MEKPAFHATDNVIGCLENGRVNLNCETRLQKKAAAQIRNPESVIRIATLVLASFAIALPVWAQTGTTETTMTFKTIGEYIAFCSDAKLSQGCYDGYEAALVKLIMSKTISNLRAPSQSGGETDEAKYQAAEALEIPRYVSWLKAHPSHMPQEFRTGLGYAIVAIYGCK